MRQVKFVVICIGILAVTMLAACGAQVAPKDNRSYYQRSLEEAEHACLNHIEYLVLDSSHGFVSATPNINPATDKPFHC